MRINDYELGSHSQQTGKGTIGGEWTKERFVVMNKGSLLEHILQFRQSVLSVNPIRT